MLFFFDVVTCKSLQSESRNLKQVPVKPGLHYSELYVFLVYQPMLSAVLAKPTCSRKESWQYEGHDNTNIFVGPLRLV